MVWMNQNATEGLFQDRIGGWDVIPPTSTGRARILIADTNRERARTLGDFLWLSGYEITHAADSQATLQHIAQAHPDLLLVSMRLTGQDGATLCAQLKSELRTRMTPVIVLTDRYDRSDRLRCIEAGADDYLCVNQEVKELEARVCALVRARQWHDQREPMEQSILGLAQVVAAKENLSANHLQRLGTLAALLGRQLGLEGEMLAAVRFAAMVRDVGKIGVDASVLHKIGPLTSTEQHQLRQHITLGERIVQPLRLAPLIGSMVRHHHERWDGAGYPDGLSGAALPLGARIIAVVEAFDALTSSSPSTPACTWSNALAKLWTEAGTRWDPYVVASLHDCLTDALSRGRGIEEEVELSLEVGSCAPCS